MNQLHGEKSPYLLQHADNPVDWSPWHEPAFARARSRGQLIFLSIGYSTCHWCHVMAHECFEDEEVAELLNRDFVSIKVDREERPDIDQVYMEVCQRLTGSGGWPLTIIMTPDGHPFYAATYIPKHGKHGRPGMMNLLPWITAKWREDPEYLRKAAQEVVSELQNAGASAHGASVSLALHAEAEQLLKRGYDWRHGGFGKAPKFPRPQDLTFLLQRYRLSKDKDCLSMVEQTLRMMRNGGIYDQLGFGFHRYSTDKEWLVPHFEKMLYDQAGLVLAYLGAWQVTGDDCYLRTVREVLTYLNRDMQSLEGAFFSAEDADSEGVEGKFYLWTRAEIAGLLADEASAFCTTYDVTDAGNYHDEVTGELTGKNILHRASVSAEKPATTYAAERFDVLRDLLFKAREKRIRPHLDDKVLTAWNGMAISAFAQTGRVLKEQQYIDSARRCSAFVLATMRDADGRLWRRYRQGEAAIAAFSEDYAFLARGLLDLYAATYEITDLQHAVDIAGVLRQFFQDPVSGRLYDTPSDGEKLLVRPSSTFDGATPSASSVAMEVFARLFLLTGDSEWKASAEHLLDSLALDISRYPAGYTQLLQSASWLLQPTREVVIVGDIDAPSTERLLSIASGSSLQQTVVLFKSCQNSEHLSRLSPFTEPMVIRNDSATAYVCQNFTCHEPINDADAFSGLLATWLQ